MDTDLFFISFYIENEQFIITSSNAQCWNENVANDLALYITNDLKKKYQVAVLSYRDLEHQNYELQQIVDLKIQYIFITIPHNHQVQTFAFKENLPTRQIFIMDNTTKIKIEKYKNNKKTEIVVLELKTIQNINKQFESQYAKFLDKNLLQTSENLGSENNDSEEQCESPKFGPEKQENLPMFGKPINKNHGNDGKSQASFLKTSQRIIRIDLKPYTLQDVAKHHTEEDAWIVVNGKIYDVTHYLTRHPGGKAKLMLGVGKDGTMLFNEYHPWVNAHYLLEKFQVGVLVYKK